MGSGAFCPWRKRDSKGLAPSSGPLPILGRVRSEAGRVNSRVAGRGRAEGNLVAGLAFTA